MQHLWDAYFVKLMRVAKDKLRRVPLRAADEEDVAISAFHSFYQGVAAGRIPKLDDRHDLWNVLLTITIRKCYAHIKRQLAAKRGGGRTRGESVFAHAGESGEPVGLDQFIASDPTPEFAGHVVDACDEMLSGLDEPLRTIARLKMEGYTNEEISQKLNVSTRGDSQAGRDSSEMVGRIGINVIRTSCGCGISQLG